MKSCKYVLMVTAFFAITVQAQEIIKEGAGWNQVLVNSPGHETAKLLKGQSYLIEIPDAAVNCLVNTEGKVIEVRFNNGFKGATSKGIKVGSPVKDLIAAYGEPQSVEKLKKAQKMFYPQIGMLFWVADKKVSQIVVYLAPK